MAQRGGNNNRGNSNSNNNNNNNNKNDNRRGGGDRRDRRGRRDGGRGKGDEERDNLDERVVHIARTSKVLKGGRRFAFRAVLVVGDQNGRVGIGVGKAREVPDAIRKASEAARKNMISVPLLGTTIPHPIESSFGAGRVLLKPASPGTGVIAGGGVRAVVEACGVKDILSKSLGSDNILNVVQATFVALQELKDYRIEADRRGVDPKKIMPFWHREEAYG